MKKLTSIILAIALSITTVCALCSCAPPLPQFIAGNEAYSDYKIIDDEDVMNIACIAGEGPLREVRDDNGMTHYEPIDFTPTVKFELISDEELQAIADEMIANDQITYYGLNICSHTTHTLNENIFIDFFGEYHGYYALGIYCTDILFTGVVRPYGYIGEIHWKKTTTRWPYILFIYTTPKKTKK